MRLLRFVCLLAIQLSAATLFLMSQSGPSSQINQAAQTNPAPIVHPSNGHAAVQIHHPGLPHDLVAKWKRRALASHGAHSASKSRSRLSKSQTTELSFAPIVNYGSGGADVDSVAVADVNGDGIPDLVVANGNFNAGADGSVAVLLGNGDGTFQAAVSYDSGGAGAEAVAIADVSGDGKPDLLVANECASSANCANGTISVLLGNGDGTFQPAISYGSGGYDAASVAVSDVNGDGIPDLVVGNSCGTSVASGGCPSVFVNGIGDEWNYEGVIGVLLGNGDGTFQTVATFDSGGTLASSVAVVDANSGNRAIVVVNYCPSQEVGPFESCWVGYYSTLGVLLGNGDGTFQPPVDYNSGGYYSDGVAVADFNRDGKPDLVLSSGEAQWGAQVGSVGVLLGNGDGTFQATQSYDSGAPWTESVAVADVIGDGNLDVVVANLCASQASCTSGSIGALLGNGNGTFQPALSYGSGGGGEFYSLAVADLNGDGKPDVAVTNECDVPSSGDCNGFVGIFINTSTSNTATALVSSVSPSNFGQSVTEGALPRMKRLLVLIATLASGFAMSAAAQTTSPAPAVAAPAGPAKIPLSPSRWLCPKPTSASAKSPTCRTSMRPRKPSSRPSSEEIDKLTKELQAQGDNLNDSAKAQPRQGHRRKDHAGQAYVRRCPEGLSAGAGGVE